MRRIVGAAVLFAVIVLPRAGGLIQTGFSNLTRPADSSNVDSLAPAKVTGDPSKPSQKHAMTAPVGYLADPLEFLSNAPVDSLVLLPGIGPVIAERIANARTGKRSFIRWEDLLTVRGIGQKKLDRLKRLARRANQL